MTQYVFMRCFKECKCYDLALKKKIDYKQYEKCYRRTMHNKKLITEFLYRYWPNSKN
jgi:hypothetical protein